MKYLAMFAMLCMSSLSCTSTRQSATAAASPAWNRIGPGGGGTTLSPVFHPTDPNRMWVRCDMSGTYVTSNGGKSWDMHNFKGGASQFAFDPANPNRMFVGGDFLYRTTDAGKTWHMVLPPPRSGREHATVWRPCRLRVHRQERLCPRPGIC